MKPGNSNVRTLAILLILCITLITTITALNAKAVGADKGKPAILTAGISTLEPAPLAVKPAMPFGRLRTANVLSVWTVSRQLSALMAGYMSAREGSGLVIEGSLFLLLGFVWGKRVRRARPVHP